MITGAAYTLEKAGVVLGTLTVTDTDMFAIRGTFKATPAFEPYRALFDEDARWAERVADDDSPAVLAQAEASLERILALGLVLRGPRGTGYRNMLLSIEGDQAGFRPLHPEEEPL
ncbi:hypothetical protein [Deinococcus multiflagellatus]|uniref:Uncharacterized protein n=1 Tax=Deinococcus multiflagellatus TaxID=1656887 RepID=A0ABW1ZS72_9DEIO|nr:hypothetical protein [Deinococcus multiflagellatus]MBZ9713619.1 hypothetical protein [Deinococcus multiflagellatus]